MSKPEEASYLVAFAEEELRLCHLGIFAIHGKGDDNNRRATRDPLYQRLGMANQVLVDRREIFAVEAKLANPTADYWSSKATFKSGTVEVRLRVSEIVRLVAGLDAFLVRTNPAMNNGRPVDPPEKVRPLRERLAKAVEAAERQMAMTEREQSLRS